MSGNPAALVLASRSPRRAELLRQVGVVFEVIAADVDETPAPGEVPEAYVRRLALAKARAVHTRVAGRAVLGADTVVVQDGRMLGKPGGREDALAMLATLSGREHRVCSGIAVLGAGRELVKVSVTRVRMRPLTREESVAYWNTGEPRDKAGAYAIQGRGAAFVEALEGSYSGVVGLPLYETAILLREVGIDLVARWKQD
ncbi:MAG TPA: Maf family protein [Gammaproteobacteria bacterium]|nr:Maf family protein [Gammaproteobacteria bacterium]